MGTPKKDKLKEYKKAEALAEKVHDISLLVTIYGNIAELYPLLSSPHMRTLTKTRYSSWKGKEDV